MKTPAHRRKKDPFGRAQLAPRITPAEVRVAGCDAPDPAPVYMAAGGGYECRCLVCARCGHHTGNTSQGHYWRLCQVTGTLREFHMCCPDDCELEA